MPSTDSEHKFHKTGFGYPENSIWDRLDWESATITTTYIQQLMGRVLIFYMLIHEVLDIHTNPNISLP